MANSRVQVIREVTQMPANDWRLCYQRVRYVFDDGGRIQNGYRFIWRRDDGSLQAARGQARIPSAKVARALMDEADKQGWGGYDADADPDSIV